MVIDVEDGGEEVGLYKRKRGAAQWSDEEDRGRGGNGRRGGGNSSQRYGGRGGRDRRGAMADDDDDDWSANAPTDAKQPFMSGNRALALDAAKRGHLGGGGAQQQTASGYSGARPSGLAGKRKFAPPRPINAVPELAESVPPMVRAALAGPPADGSYHEEDPIMAEKLKGTRLHHTLHAHNLNA